ncbi:hypothetical protein H072_8303 [Dactylellina haptotyla CBS 200.50]|uniref:Uncharacterized protein n=1 Tax=Dactylellina haptotyla (strain CBS 200.50) TaxID=1284197 RepID=S8BRX8_DACHA|nr:hypothetical protein H072_8303 [Dactylellina haptotyla CBS 200.50]
MDEEYAQYWMALLGAKLLSMRDRGYHTIYDSDDSKKLEILKSISSDSNVPKVLRQYVAAILTNTEYENMFQEGRNYVLRNLDKMEYIEFPTDRLERKLVQPAGSFDDTVVKMLHPGEKLVDAITWDQSVDRKSEAVSLDKGIWAGHRIDLVLADRLAGMGWRKLK